MLDQLDDIQKRIELEIQNVPSKNELHYESIFFNVKTFSNGPKKRDGKYFFTYKYNYFSGFRFK